MADNEETMGQRLRRLREAKELSQPALARLAGVPLGTLRNWEQDRRVPRLDAAVILARVLEVTLDYLAGVLVDETAPRPVRKKPKKES
jgi:transcriptional regulator with XRE-family HTH domain